MRFSWKTGGRCALSQKAACSRGSVVNVQPVIRRELQAASRRRETWRLRLYFSGSALASAVFGLLLPQISPSDRGTTVLICLAVCGFALSLLAGAFVTADAISSEKRDGTLGLLFLTPLNGWEIVFGKMFTHSLQVKYAVLGSFPLFFLPVLLGGVLWYEVARILLVVMLTLLLSLACGVFWSTLAKEARAAVLATTVTMLLVTLLPWSGVLIQGMIGGKPNLTGIPQASPMTALILGFEKNYRGFGARGPWASGVFLYWGSVWCNLTWSLILLGVSGWLLPRIWRRAEAGQRLPGSPSTQFADSQKPLAPARMPALDAAPLLWLAARESRPAVWVDVVRAGTVVLFGLMLVISVTTRFWEMGFITAFFSAYGLHLLTRIELALAATRHLHEERRTGALEIMLTTPVPAEEVVRAHHKSLKRAFRNRLVLLLTMNALLELGVILFPKQLHMGGGAWLMFTVMFVGGAMVTLADFAALRWLGLREALRNPTQLKAAGRAFTWLVAVPWPAIAATFLLAMAVRDETAGALIFGLWFAGCLFYDLLLKIACINWLRFGLRRRLSEGQSRQPP